MDLLASPTVVLSLAEDFLSLRPNLGQLNGIMGDITLESSSNTTQKQCEKP